MKAFIEGHGEHKFDITKAHGFIAERIEIDANDVRMMLNILEVAPHRLSVLLEQLESRFPENRVIPHTKLMKENAALRYFVTRISRMTKGGEVPEGEGSEPFEMTSDDNYETLMSLIDESRQIIKRV